MLKIKRGIKNMVAGALFCKDGKEELILDADDLLARLNKAYATDKEMYRFTIVDDSGWKVKIKRDDAGLITHPFFIQILREREEITIVD